MEEKKELSLYVHVPFCRSKCAYCDFASYSGQDSLIGPYFQALEREIFLRASLAQDCRVTTVYIGGGTPSYVPEEYIAGVLEQIKRHYPMEEGAEITVECNPGTITREKAACYRQNGVNRVSMGLQAVQNRLLKEIGRIHTWEAFLEGYELVKRCGVNNINVDLMFSLPGQRLGDLEESIEKVTRLGASHVSLYSLILEEGTPLCDRYEKEGILLNEELDRRMCHRAKGMLEDRGYRQYEISNYALEGRESRHNVNCWEMKEYMGFGSGAHSYFRRQRSFNEGEIGAYLEQADGRAYAAAGGHFLEEREEMEDFVMLGLRLVRGVDLGAFAQRFGRSIGEVFGEAVKEMVGEGLLVVKGREMRLTEKGFDFANRVMCAFLA